jgi:soluble cytochrome b562
MRRGTAAAVALVLALGAGACGEAPEDEAREDGEQVGEAVKSLFDAGSADEARAAINQLKIAVSGLDGDTRKRVQEQVDVQRSTLNAAGEAATTGDLDALKQAAQQVRSQADSFRSGEHSVANEFWRGFEEGYDG